MPSRPFIASQDASLFTTIGKGTDHLTVKVKVLSVKATLHRLIDSDATANFVSFRFVKKKNLTPESLYAPAVRGVNNKVLAEASPTEYY